MHVYTSTGLIDQTLKTIFVSRMDNQSRQDCYNEIIRRVDSPYDWPPVLIYPEGTSFVPKFILIYKLILYVILGTTTNGKCLVRFKHGKIIDRVLYMASVCVSTLFTAKVCVFAQIKYWLYM